jgi:hypothetical protein
MIHAPENIPQKTQRISLKSIKINIKTRRGIRLWVDTITPF